MIWEWLHFVLAPTAVASHRPQVVVSEVAWAGSSVSTADEWLELWNDDDQVVDLTGWTLWNVAEETPSLLFSIPDGQIAPGGYFLIANNAADHEFRGGRSVLMAEPDLIEPDLSLSNSHFALELRTSEGEAVDTVGNGEAPFAGDRALHASMQRILDRVRRGDRERAWETSQEARGLDAEVVDLGTPTTSGRPLIGNDPCQVVWQPGQVEQPLPVQITDPDPTTPLTEVTVDGVALTTPVLRRLPLMGDQVVQLNVTDASGLSRRREIPCRHVEASSSIALSEIYAAPTAGSVEFVELMNTGAVPVDLLGWQLGDAHEVQAFTVTESLVLAPGAHQAFLADQTKLRLNDGAETVVLTAPDGRQERIELARSRKGLSWSYATEWGWGIPTPSSANALVASDDEPSVGGAPLPATLADLVAHRAPALPNAVIEFVATVSVSQSQYDPRQFIVSDGEWSAEVQLPEGVVVDLADGAVIRVIGRVSRSATPRVLAEASGIERATEYRERALSIDELHEPRLLQRVRLTGRVVRHDGESYVELGARQYQLTSRRGVDLPALGVGDEVAVEGLIVATDPLRLRILDTTGLLVVSPALADVPAQAPEPEALPGDVQFEAQPAPAVDQPSELAPAPLADAIVAVLATLTKRMLGIQEALAMSTESIVLPVAVAPAQRRVPTISLLTLFALLMVAGILADWLWQTLLAQSELSTNSGRSPPNL